MINNLNVLELCHGNVAESNGKMGLTWKGRWRREMPVLFGGRVSLRSRPQNPRSHNTIPSVFAFATTNNFCADISTGVHFKGR